MTTSYDVMDMHVQYVLEMVSHGNSVDIVYVNIDLSGIARLWAVR